VSNGDVTVSEMFAWSTRFTSFPQKDRAFRRVGVSGLQTSRVSEKGRCCRPWVTTMCQHAHLNEGECGLETFRKSGDRLDWVRPPRGVVVVEDRRRRVEGQRLAATTMPG